MKKAFCVLLAVLLVVCLGIPAFAKSSPVAQPKLKVVFVKNSSAKPTVREVGVDEAGHTVMQFEADDSYQNDEFSGWSVYDSKGKTAVEGTDYIIVKEENKIIILTPLDDVIVVAEYGNKKTDITAAIEVFKGTSPKTGDALLPMLCAMLALAMAGIVVTKKKLAY